MNKICKLMLMLIVASMISIVPVVSNAETSSTKDNVTESTKAPTTESTKEATTTPITIEGVYITSKAGEYKTDDVITFEVRFSDDISLEKFGPSLQINIGEITRTAKRIYEQKNGKIIKYEYTIGEYDSGKITFKSLENGSDFYVIPTNGNSDTVKNEIKDFKNSEEIIVNPLVWTDFSNAEYSIEYINTDNKYHMTLDKVNLIDKHNYQVFFVHGDEKLNIQTDEDGKITNSYSYITDGNSILTNINDVLELNGKIYMYVVEEQNDYSNNKYTNKVVIDRKEIERPAKMGLTQRTRLIYITQDKDLSTSIFINEPMSERRKFTIQFGKVTDISILRDIKNQKADGMNELLNYAKSEKGIETYSLTWNGYKEDFKDICNINNIFNKGEYYYTYIKVDNENGKYVDLEDIHLFSVLFENNNTLNGGKWFLASEADDKFAWTISDENPVTDTTKPAEDNKNTDNKQEQPKDDTVSKEDKLPFTGVGIGLIMSIVVVTIAGIIMYKKVKYYKGI